MAFCPIFIHAIVSSPEPALHIWNLLDPKENTFSNGVVCIESRCQMWNPEINDCGLKQQHLGKIVDTKA
jgi:hypothetical protein